MDWRQILRSPISKAQASNQGQSAPQSQPQSGGVGNTLALDVVSQQKLYPIWQAKYIEANTNGNPYPQFNEWVPGFLAGQYQ